MRRQVSKSLYRPWQNFKSPDPYGKESRLADALKNLSDKKEIFTGPYHDLHPLGSRPEIMYGSAKVHKIVTDGLPSFRHILSAISTPTYKLAKFLVPMLEPLATNE